MPNFAAAFSRARNPSGTTSLPIPSPGITAIRCILTPTVEAVIIGGGRVAPRGRRARLVLSSDGGHARHGLPCSHCHDARRRSPMSERQYWIGVVSQDDVDAAIAHGFVQLSYGKAGPLAR